MVGHFVYVPIFVRQILNLCRLFPQHGLGKTLVSPPSVALQNCLHSRKFKPSLIRPWWVCYYKTNALTTWTNPLEFAFLIRLEASPNWPRQLLVESAKNVLVTLISVSNAGWCGNIYQFFIFLNRVRSLMGKTAGSIFLSVVSIWNET